MATRIEERLQALVQEAGFDYIEEKQFGPYRVDVYSPELHVAFEADGPWHRRRKDEERDEFLMAHYKLVVFRAGMKRLNSAPGRAELLRLIINSADGWASTANARINAALALHPEGF